MPRLPIPLFVLAFALAGALSGCNLRSAVCDAPQISCDEATCVDPTVDPKHCGGCGITCAAGQICQSGACQCPAGTTLCGGICVSTQNDPDNCGGCGKACGGGLASFCQQGECVSECSDPTPDACGGACVDLQRDVRHCGTCGNACPQGESCISGACRSVLFAACFNTGELVGLDENGVRSPTSVATGAGPQSIASHGGKLLVADGIDNALYRYTRAPLAREEGFDRLGKSVNQVLIEGDRAYTINSADNNVQVIDISRPLPTGDQEKTVNTVAQIPTVPPSLESAENTFPYFGAFAGGKLYVTLYGNCIDAAAGHDAGNRLLEIDVDGEGSVGRELVFDAADYGRDDGVTENSPRPAGVAAVGSRLFVAIGNLQLNCFGAAGPGYVAVVETSGEALTLTKNIELPGECRNPGAVASHGGRVYVSCGGAYGFAPTVQESLVVIDAETEKVINTTTFSRCSPTDPFDGPDACRTAVPGRVTVLGDRLYIADNNAGRLLVTDLDGNKIPGTEDGIAICPLKCDDEGQNCYQFTADVHAAP